MNELSAEPTPSPLRRTFYGADGLRAGWSLLLFAVSVGAVYEAARYAAKATAQHSQPQPIHSQLKPLETIFTDFLCLAIVAAAAFLVSRVEDRSFSLYGLTIRRDPHRLPDLAQGLLWGFAFLSFLVVALRSAGLIAFSGFALAPTAAIGYALAWATAFLCVGLFEEFFFRGFLQYTAARGITGLVHALAPRSRYAHAIGFWAATLLFSVAFFAFLHTTNAGESPVGLAAVAAAGLTFAYSLWRTGTLWWAVGFHAAWDWSQSFLFGVADSGSTAAGHLLITHPVGRPLWSGGLTGPEGSVLVFPTLALAALVIRFTLPRRTHPLAPGQPPEPTPFTLTEDAAA